MKCKDEKKQDHPSSGPSEVLSRIAGFKIQNANHYTITPLKFDSLFLAEEIETQQKIDLTFAYSIAKVYMAVFHFELCRHLDY